MSYIIEIRPRSRIRRLVLAVVPFWIAVGYLVTRLVQS
jgi:hypothetical protein